MLTGFNTDVAYGGITYHVQTEDKGIGNPIILSLVYQGGTILASKRTNYADLIQDGQVDEGELAKMLERQHRILVAAIQAGKSERLVQLSRQQNEAENSNKVSFAAKAEVVVGTISRSSPVPASFATPGFEVSTRGHSSQMRSMKVAPSLEQLISSYVPSLTPQERLKLELLTAPNFQAGEKALLRVAVSFGGSRPAENVPVTVQIVGTRICAQSLAARTDSRGLADFEVNLPTFTAGAAALILKASDTRGQEAETKFLIRRKVTEP